MWCPEPAFLKQENLSFHISNWDSALQRKNALLCGAQLGFVQDQLWAGLARSLVGARLLLALGLTHAQWGTLIRAGLARRSARLGTVRVLARYPTRLGSRLHSRLGSARLRSGLTRIGLGRYSRLYSAQLEAGLCWLEALLGMARGLVRLGSSIGPARTRLEARDSAQDSVWV